MAIMFVKQGGCALIMYQDIIRQRWQNKKQENMTYFYLFERPPKSVAGWNILTTSPYLDIFVSKFIQMEQAGIMARLQHQYNVFNPMETEVLKPLKLEHFYITLIGIIVGVLLALVSFMVEHVGQPQKNLLQAAMG